MPQSYARDVAITAVLCFIGGIGLTLLAVLIYRRVSHRKKLRESQRQKDAEEATTTVIGNHVSHNRQPGGNARSGNLGAQLRSRADEDGSPFQCPDCSAKGQRGAWPNQMRLSNGINRGMEAEEEMEKRRMRVMPEEERRRPRTQHGIVSMDLPDKVLPHSRPEKTRDMDGNKTRAEGRTHGSESLRCESCHRSYRPPEQNMVRPGRTHTAMRDLAVHNNFPSQHRDRIDHHRQFDAMKNRDLGRESRNVTFDLESARNREQGPEKTRSPREKEKGKKKRQLRVKLNLSPVRKSKVHPKGRSSKNGKEKKSGKKKKENGDEKKDKEGQNKSEQDGKEGENAQPGEGTSAAGQAGSSVAFGHGQMLHGLQYQQAGMLLRGAHHPAANLSMLGSAASRFAGPNMSLQGGNMLLNARAPGHSALFPNGPRPVAPGMAAPRFASAGMLNSFGQPPGVGLPSSASAASLVANAVPANSLLQPTLQTVPQAGGLSMNLVAKPAVNLAPTNHSTSQGHVPPDSSPLLHRQTAEPAQGPGLQAGEGPHQRPMELQVPQTKESHPVQIQAPQTASTSGKTNQIQSQSSVTTAEPASSDKTGAVKVPDSSTVTGDTVPTVAPPVGVSRESTEAASVSVAGVSVPEVSSQSGPPAGGADGAAGSAASTTLLQQEYVSEEGGSSPRRKLRLVLPEKTSSRPPTALEKKIR